MTEGFLLKVVLVACLAALIALCVLAAIFAHLWRDNPAGGQSVTFWTETIKAIVHDPTAPLSQKLDLILAGLNKETRP